MEFAPVRNQKFEIGRTINPFLCDCNKCDFLHCPKHNYCVKVKPKKYSYKNFWETHKEEIVKLNKPLKYMYSFHKLYDLVLNYKLLTDLIDMCFSFPKGTFWSPENPMLHFEKIEENIDDQIYRKISLVTMSRSGNEVFKGSINIADGRINNYDLNQRQEKLADKMSECISWLKEQVFEYYQEKDKEWKIGWLSPEGRFYPCSSYEHIKLANILGESEMDLELKGYIKIFSTDSHLGYSMEHRLSAEQRNWLSLNGYEVR